MIETTIGLWVGVFLTVCVFTFAIIRENLLFRLAEHMLIGLMLGINIVMAVKSIGDNSVYPLMQGDVSWIIPILLGIALFGAYSKKYFHITRWPTAILVGTGAGLTLKGMAEAHIYKQIAATVALPLTDISNIIILVGVISSVSYFTFTWEHKGSFSYLPKLGIYFIMAFFGGNYIKYTVTRLSWLAGRIEFILRAFGLI